MSAEIRVTRTMRNVEINITYDFSREAFTSHLHPLLRGSENSICT